MSYKDYYNTVTWSKSTTADTTMYIPATQVFKVEMPSGWNKPAQEVQVEPFAKYLGQEMLFFYPRANKEYGADNTQSPGNIQYVNLKDLLARFFIQTYFQLERVPNWRGRCIGISSMMEPARGPGGMHMPMFDYDGNVKKKIKKDVATFQEKYGLGDAWVYRTKKGYHVYFFCDQVSHEIFMQMLQEADCCEGFRDKSRNNNYAVMRVSAKYTSFDIELEYILKSKNTSVVKRPLRKAHIIQGFISLGQECKTHFASMFPQWARFKEDTKEWRAPAKPRTRRVRRKSGSKNPFTPEEILHMREEILEKEAQQLKSPADFAKFEKKLGDLERMYFSDLKVSPAMEYSTTRLEPGWFDEDEDYPDDDF